MKSIMIGFIIVVTSILGLGILFSINSRSIREEELAKNLGRAMEQSIRSLISEDGKARIGRDAFATDFLESLTLSMESDGDIKIEVLAIDNVRGLLSVRATEEYRHPNGRRGKISCRKTIILEQETQREDAEQGNETKFYNIIFRTDSQTYKAYVLAGGSSLLLPVPPIKEGYLFSCWQSKEGAEITEGEIRINEDLTFDAVFIK